MLNYVVEIVYKKIIVQFSAPIDNVKIRAPAKNKTATSYDDIDFTNTSESPKGKPWNFKISNWNVDGIRAWLSKGGLDYITYERPNILCIQEIKCAQSKLPEEVKTIPGYHAYWLSSEKDGYAGVAVYTKELAINVEYGLRDEELDDEGRIITAEYEQFFLICTYVPNSSRKLVNLPKRLKWNEVFRNYVKELDKKKPVIICGDMNVAHNEIGKLSDYYIVQTDSLKRKWRLQYLSLASHTFFKIKRAVLRDIGILQ